jgi:hypothetical protein
MFKRFFKKKIMPTEELNENVTESTEDVVETTETDESITQLPQEPCEKNEQPGVEVPAGPQVPGQNLNQGGDSGEDPSLTPKPEEVAEAKPEGTTIDPMQPVDRG